MFFLSYVRSLLHPTLVHRPLSLFGLSVVSFYTRNKIIVFKIYAMNAIRCGIFHTVNLLYKRLKWSHCALKTSSFKFGTTILDFRAFKMTITWEGDLFFFLFFYCRLLFFYATACWLLILVPLNLRILTKTLSTQLVVMKQPKVTKKVEVLFLFFIGILHGVSLPHCVCVC